MIHYYHCLKHNIWWQIDTYDLCPTFSFCEECKKEAIAAARFDNSLGERSVKGTPCSCQGEK